MRIGFRKTTIYRLDKPGHGNVDRELQWLGSSLGLFGMRDKDRSCYRIFISLIRAGKQGKPLSSDEIAYQLELSRGTVIHHVRKLMQAGIVDRIENRYILKAPSLQKLIEEVRKDLQKTMQDLDEVAKDIDRKLGW